MDQPPLGTGWLEHRARLQTATVITMQNHAGEAESMMKSEAPWQDRTGLARAGLGAQATLTEVSPELARYGLTFFHSQQYGKWLETTGGPAMGHRAGMSLEQLEAPEVRGPYAVIYPVIEQVGPRVVADVISLWGGLF